jgi:hypothetical protein
MTGRAEFASKISYRKINYRNEQKNAAPVRRGD